MIIETIQVTQIDGEGWVVQGDNGNGHVRASVQSYPSEKAAADSYFAGKVKWEE